MKMCGRAFAKQYLHIKTLYDFPLNNKCVFFIYLNWIYPWCFFLFLLFGVHAAQPFPADIERLIPFILLSFYRLKSIYVNFIPLGLAGSQSYIYTFQQCMHNFNTIHKIQSFYSPAPQIEPKIRSVENEITLIHWIKDINFCVKSSI